MSSIHWYIDASHQAHDDCRGHNGALMTLGRGATLSSSTKQKINTKSSTESEIVGLYDKTGVILWTRNFLEAQGYTITDNFVYQDNMSTLSLAKMDTSPAPNDPNTSKPSTSSSSIITVLRK
jgi:hypothetical protein